MQTHTSSSMASMRVGFHSRTRSMMKPKKIQLKPPVNISAECSVQMPRLRAPSVLRLALCTFLRKKLSSLVVSVVEPNRHLLSFWMMMRLLVTATAYALPPHPHMIMSIRPGSTFCDSAKSISSFAATRNHSRLCSPRPAPARVHTHGTSPVSKTAHCCAPEAGSARASSKRGALVRGRHRAQEEA